MLATTSELTFMVCGIECEIYQRSKQTILHVSSRHPIRPISATSPASSISGAASFVSARDFKPRDEAIEAKPRMMECRHHRHYNELVSEITKISATHRTTMMFATSLCQVITKTCAKLRSRCRTWNHLQWRCCPSNSRDVFPQ